MKINCIQDDKKSDKHAQQNKKNNFNIFKLLFGKH